jgi:hypothetical protein
MDQVAVLTAILLLSILGQGTNSDQQNKKLVAEIPFDRGETRILREEQTRKLWEARSAIIEAQKNAPVERVIIEGYFTGQANPDNTRRAAERAGATKKWLQGSGGLSRIAMDDRVGAAGENKRVAKISIEERAENEAGRTAESPRVLPDILFSQNSSEVRDYNALWEAREEIRYDVQQKGPARLVIEGHAAQNETKPSNQGQKPCNDRETLVRDQATDPQSPGVGKRGRQSRKQIHGPTHHRERASANIPLTRRSTSTPQGCQSVADDGLL